MSKTVVIFFAVLLMAGLAQCGGGPPDPAVLETTMTVDAAANRGTDGQGRPLTIKLLRLKEIGKFQAADFFALQDPEAALGADLVGMEEMVLTPDGTVEKELIFEPEAKYFGVVAAYRKIGGVQWKAFEAVPPEDETPTMVEFGPGGVVITIDP